MADLTELDRANVVKIAGANPSTGITDNYMDVDVNGNARIIATSSGPVTPGAVATNSNLMGGQYNTSLPSLSNTQQVAIQVDSSGRLIISPTSSSSVVTVNNLPTTVDTNFGTVGASTLRGAAQIGNATGAALFGAGTTTAQVLRVVLPTDQTAIPATQSGTWTIKAQLQDNAGNALNSTNNQLQVRDVINTSGQYRAQSVTTSAAEALGAATILVNRKYLSIVPTNGTVYWGYSNAVTTTTGSPIFKNQYFTIATTDNIHIYVIAGATTDCRITEGS